MNYISVRLSYLHSCISELEASIKKLPDRDIFYTKSGKYIRWYISNGSKPIYLHKHEKNLVRELVLRKYYMQKLLEYKSEYRELEKIENIRSDIADNMLKESNPYSQFLKDAMINDEIREWKTREFEKSNNYPERLIYGTLNGDVVRSKSEVMIANALYMRGIPYRYECALRLDEIKLYPDFTIINPINSEIYYWEHFGMMDNYTYAKRAKEKQEIYLNHNIIPGINLITSYETGDNPLDARVINRYIDIYFAM